MSENSVSALNISQAMDKVTSYWEFYGLCSDPFESIKISKEPYLQSWEHKFDLLQHFFRGNNAVVALSTSQPCGKSTFLNQFALQFDSTNRICRLSSSDIHSPNEFLNEIAKSFNLPPNDSDITEEKLDFYLTQFQFSSGLSLVFIDNAEQLPTEILEIIFYWIRHQSESQMRLHVLLVGNKELQQKLKIFAQNNELREQDVIYHLEFHAFSLAETQSYIRYRLHNAGLPAALPFSSSDIAQIYKESKGIPHQIDNLAKKILIERTQQSKPSKIYYLIQSHKPTIIGGIIIVAAFLLLALGFKNLEVNKNQIKQRPKSKIVNAHSYSTTITPLKSENKAMVSFSTHSFSWPHTLPPQLQQPKDKVLAQQPKPSARDFNQPNSAQSKSNEKLVKVEHQILVLNDEPPKPKPLAIPTRKKKDLVKENNSSHLPYKNKNKNNLVLPRNDYSHLTPQEHRLLAVPSQFFTLQLIGVSNLKTLFTFIEQNHLSKAIYFQSRLNGKPWYVLLYGKYPSGESAKKAIQTLPKVVQAQKPWVRTLLSVHQSIKRNTENQ